MADAPATPDPAATPAVSPSVPPAEPAAASASPPASPPSAAPPVEPAAKAKAHEPDWRDDRIAVLTAKLRNSQTKPSDATITPTTIRPEDVDRLANERAAQIAANARFNDDCNQTVDAGRKQFQDFDDKMRELGRVVTPGDPESVGAYVTLINAALKTGEAARVIHQLGSDLSTAQRLMQLDPMSMAVEVTKIAAGASKGNEISAAPKPITPVGGRGNNIHEISADDPNAADKLSTKEWMVRRIADVAKKGGDVRSRYR